MSEALDFANLPPRLTTAEVCGLARISAVTLWRRITAAPRFSTVTMFSKPWVW
jgi:hypothetical protein